jgi:hypothetical protein
MALLWLNKDTLFASSVSNGSAVALSPAITHFLVRWSPLFNMFHPRAWFWSPLVLLRRSSFVLASVLLLQQPAVRFMAFSILNFASLLLHLLVRPFDTDVLNHLESTSYILLVFVSMLLTGYLPPYPLALQVMLFVLIVPPTGAMTMYIIQQQWRELQSKMEVRKATLNAEAARQQEQLELASVHENPLRTATLMAEEQQRSGRADTVHAGDIAVLCDVGPHGGAGVDQQQQLHLHSPHNLTTGRARVSVDAGAFLDADGSRSDQADL